MSGSRTLIVGGVTLALIAAGAGSTSSARLDKEACRSLSTELNSLVAAGVKSDMQRGAEWASANLAPARLEEIKRLIELGEQLEFRCGAAGSSAARLAKNPGAEDDDDKPTRANRAKRGKHAPEERSDAVPEMKHPVAEGAATQEDETDTPAQAEPASAEAAPAEEAHAPVQKLAMPVKTLTAAEAAAKRALEPVVKSNVAASGDDVAPSLGVAPTLGKAGAAAPATTRVKAAVVEAPPVPTLGMAASPPTLGMAAMPASVSASSPASPPTSPPASMTIPGLGQAAAAASAAAPSLGKAAAPASAAALPGATAGKKAQRRRSSTTYVSPVDVNPSFLTRYGTAP